MEHATWVKKVKRKRKNFAFCQFVHHPRPFFCAKGELSDACGLRCGVDLLDPLSVCDGGVWCSLHVYGHTRATLPLHIKRIIRNLIPGPVHVVGEIRRSFSHTHTTHPKMQRRYKSVATAHPQPTGSSIPL